ncbi:SDR family oxidoreductase [Bacteroides sp. GD17]|jgi:NAD(P)-dependent dehydrogenase (short-subunit alcohol dehydrogenase family)|uniref:SDR family NAD(P)-dependent oxidoreductase n=1 Tax=Bacteroides sp. GD17 TaxID=3139826 RepID=UPI0025D667D6|nr:SDR family oxidoreductase [uncultured Bacteroides sp.]
MYNPFSLEGKKILITGASSGIGRSIAVECSYMGATLIITARNKERLDETLSLMRPGNHMAITCNLMNEEDIVNLVDSLPQLKGVVHNAGVNSRTLCKTIKKSDLETVLSPNFYGPVLLQKQLLKKKKIAKEASIVFIASRAPFAPSVGNAIYSASKGAILGYAQVLGLELAPQKIRVNSICPAMVWTELVVKDSVDMGVNYEELQAKYPLKRYGKPEDVAYLTIYLLSDASSWMTGSSIDLTGGGEGTLA